MKGLGVVKGGTEENVGRRGSDGTNNKRHEK